MSDARAGRDREEWDADPLFWPYPPSQGERTKGSVEGRSNLGEGAVNETEREMMQATLIVCRGLIRTITPTHTPPVVERRLVLEAIARALATTESKEEGER